MKNVDVIIVGAGAAGLMCGIEAGKRGRKVIILDHANKAGKKILMSGGGRCNFTNLSIQPTRYISHNKHFCKSALNRYTQWDFINLVKSHGIPFHEKSRGQLFCDNKSQDILTMLLKEATQYGVEILLNTDIKEIEKQNKSNYRVNSSRDKFNCDSLVIASGGLSIPTMGASPFGYKVAEQFGIKIWPTRAGLVPFTLHKEDKEKLSVLSGISVNSVVSNKLATFDENILFTHRGLSGPAILQISSYWNPGEELVIDLLPNLELNEVLNVAKNQKPHKELKNILNEYFPKRLLEVFLSAQTLHTPLQLFSFLELSNIAKQFNHWCVIPNGTEGYRTAEVTLGGVDVDALSSKTCEAKNVPGLYFIGEVLDVSGWLGGYNFQWAWSSGWAAGQVV